MNAPQTLEGVQVWDLVGRLGGQMRVAPSGGIVGWDMGAVLALASALGVPGVAVAELLPAIEAAMVAQINERIASSEVERDDV